MKFMELVGHGGSQGGSFSVRSSYLMRSGVAPPLLKWLCPHSPAGSRAEPGPQTHFDAFTTLKTHLVTSFLTFRVGG